jgi:hypothetical protein
MTTQQQLDQLNAAIQAIETGSQEYRTAGGRTVRRGDLAVMYRERQRLEAKLASDSYDVTVAVFDRR